MISAGLDADDASFELVVRPEEAGLRLDQFLAARLTVARAEARRLLERGEAALGGRALGLADKGRRLGPGDCVRVRGFAPIARRHPLPESEAPLPVLARGAGWIAVDKPPGRAVHPLRPDETGTLLNALVARHPEVLGVGEGGLRSGVVHRLDVDTSGVVLFALEEAVWRRLRAAFREQRVEKTYRALVAGSLEGAGRETARLEVARHRPARVKVLPPEPPGRGRSAELGWRVLESFGEATLLEVRPRGGFLHQIRAMLAHRGHPVVGDRTYGGARVPGLAARHLLHAAALRVAEGPEVVLARSPDPPDFEAALRRLRG